MKKINKFFLMGSVALTGVMGLAACSSEDTPDAPSTGDVTAVKTQFALNIPRANGGTRMGANETQANKNFNGMYDIHMYAFNVSPVASSKNTSVLTLADIKSGITESSSSQIYNDVTVPVGTTNFLFYAHATQGKGADDRKDENNFTRGTLAVGFCGESAEASSIEPTLVTAAISDKTSSDALLAVLDKVAGVDGFATATDGSELKDFYDSFISLKAGSANNIKLALQTLYNEIYGAVASVPATKTVADAIRAAITENGTFKVSGTEGAYVLATSNTYPNDINLPDGAVQLTYNSTDKKFSYTSTTNNVGFQGLNAATICFPASIYYYQSSKLAATANVIEDWPKTTTDWEKATWVKGDGVADGWTESVTSTTRSIAMRDNINYGVASLKLVAKSNASILKDKNDVDVTINSKGFPVTGLLIGGQPSKVGYDFQPTGDQFTQVVYDKDIKGINAAYDANNTSATSAPNYTIVLPNKVATGTQSDVNIAVEFENNTGVDFQGVDGVVPAGGKFYLIGKLKPAEGSKTDTNVTEDNPAVFMSDYQTTVTVGVSKLSNAYNTIPDLRSTKMQLGISVDLTWLKGLNFDITLD